ncbi:uncharacterized protein LOC122649714 [Telopea speciosissima]|uniref:uncharacterized protein LOC122649714 n=1 Tax=Telopea speciosissima TaxID=54955 RepID=UPI001CC7C7D3|nr:uncharacterized protein LOC122649714 [Telopea speciosissima]
MVYTYTPAYYSSLHDTITSLCKNILPFSFKKRRLLASEQKLSKQQSENLKWQQESFHRILNLIGLQKEGIVPESEVSGFRSHLLDTLIASPANQEQPPILRDKLLFLQELFYAKCISEEEYHSSKRPLLQRLAVQGAEIEARDVIVAGQISNSEEEWSVIDLKEDQCLMDQESLPLKNKPKHRSPVKQIKGAASMINFVSPYKSGKSKGKGGTMENFDPNIISTGSSANDTENPFWNMSSNESDTRSILMSESSPLHPIKAEKDRISTDKARKKPFRTLFLKEHKEENRGDPMPDPEERATKSAKKQWGFDGFKKWKRSHSEDETTPLSLGEKSDERASSNHCPLVSSPIGEGPDTKLIKKKIHSDGSASDFFIDKVLGENIKKELSRIQAELCTTNPNLQFSNDQIDAISTRLPVDKADLKKFFPKSWCDRYGEIVLDVVKKEFKDHVGEMENQRNVAREKQGSSGRWVTFEDNNENSHPNLFL